MVMVCVCCGRMLLTDVMDGMPLVTLIAVLGGDTRFNAGDRFGFRLSVAVSVSPLSSEERIRLLNVAVPDASGTELVPVADSALSRSVIVTVLVAGANAAPLSVNVTTGAG